MDLEDQGECEGHEVCVLRVIESFIFEMGVSSLLPASMKLWQVTLPACKTSHICDRSELLDQDTQTHWNSFTLVSSLLRCHFSKRPFLIILFNIVPCVLPTHLSTVFLLSVDNIFITRIYLLYIYYPKT